MDNLRNWNMEKENNKKSIWKPINEFPKEKGEGQVVIGDIDKNIGIAYYSEGRFILATATKPHKYCAVCEEHFISINRVDKWCHLSDFIKQQEALEERITKLEQLIK